MTYNLSLLFASAHSGAYLSLQPLEEAIGRDQIHYLTCGPAKQRRDAEGFSSLDAKYLADGSKELDSLIEEMEIKAVVRGTSVITDEHLEFNPEKLAALAANRTRIPVIAIEDFPGNFRLGPGERLDCLFVGEDSTIALHHNRGVEDGLVFNVGLPRYNELRNVDRSILGHHTRMTLGLDDGAVVLWAGQPDGENSYLALERLLNGFNDSKTTILFRAHPRDLAYTSGRYQNQLSDSRINLLDVSDYQDVIGLCCASDLVATQFSSLAVEASHLGVPALFVLYDDLGKDYLQFLYGSNSLPWCADQCSFVIENEIETKKVLKTALFDESARSRVRDNFQSRFVSSANSARVIADKIMKLACDSEKQRKEIQICQV